MYFDRLSATTSKYLFDFVLVSKGHKWTTWYTWNCLSPVGIGCSTPSFFPAGRSWIKQSRHMRTCWRTYRLNPANQLSFVIITIVRSTAWWPGRNRFQPVHYFGHQLKIFYFLFNYINLYNNHIILLSILNYQKYSHNFHNYNLQFILKSRTY